MVKVNRKRIYKERKKSESALFVWILFFSVFFFGDNIMAVLIMDWCFGENRASIVATGTSEKKKTKETNYRDEKERYVFEHWEW